MTVRIPTGTEVIQMLVKLGLRDSVSSTSEESISDEANIYERLDTAYQEFERGEHEPQTDFLDKVKAWIKKR